MFDDDDDAEPQFNVVDNYHFEEAKDKPVCFSVLPLKFGENDEAACLDSKKVDLHGFADNGLHTVHTEVVAWRVAFDYEQPKISVLSSEGNWIELLKVRKCYEKTVRSILVTVQMLHFVKKRPRKRKRSLLDHLCGVFNKFDSKPAEYDLKKHHSIIKLFTERDPTLMKSKILQNFIEDTSRKIKEGTDTKELTVVSSGGEEEDSDDENDDDYDDKDDNINDDYSCNDDDSSDDDNGDDKDDNSNDDSDDDDKDDDGGTDQLCAMCDNGGKLVSCEGRCKRAFHPREKDGRESNCKTLGFTSAQLREVDPYLCKNCEYKQHQCFKCGGLEPSYGPNAKVFQCYKASCGHFYHPRCVAKLLEPHDTDGACKLEKRISAGMSFTCPAHWCSKCGNMEDSTQIALWLAVCRRCPVSYHKQCLPSKISFEKKCGASVRAWHLGDRIIIYCRHHKIVDTIGTPRRDHIKFPSGTEIDRTRDHAVKKAKVTGKRKRNTDQGSIGSAELSNKLCREEGKQTQGIATNNSTEHVVLKERCFPKKGTVHVNQAQNDELDNLIMEEQAEGDVNNFKSGKERDMHRGENAHGHYLISGQEKDIVRSSRMGGSTYEHDSRLENEKIPQNESNKFDTSSRGSTPDHVDGLPQEKQVQVAHVEKTTTTNSIDTHKECGCDGDQEVDGSYACQRELKSPQCNDNPTATEIDTSGDESTKRGEPKEQATDCKMLDLDRNRKNVYMKNGRDACFGDENPQRLDNYKESGVPTYKFRNKDLNINSPRCSPSKNSPRRGDDQRAAEASEYKSREGRGSNSREEWKNNNSPMRRRNPRKRSRDYSLEGQRMDYHNSYPRSNNEHIYEQQRHNDCSSDGDGDRRRWSRRDDYCCDVGRRLSPQQSAFSPANFDTNGRCSPPSYPRRAEYGASVRRGSPSYLRRSEHITRGRSGPCPVHSNPPDVEYDEYTNLEYGGYHAMPIAPVARYFLRGNYTDACAPQTDATMGECAAVYGVHISDYGVRSDYPQRNRLNREDKTPAAGSVTERYAPHLDRTNLPIRGQGALPDAGFMYGGIRTYIDKPLW